MAESLRILLLEDNPADAELTKFELEEAGFAITLKVVETEGDFIRGLQEYCPDLILSDYDLPRYNGALALAEARSRCPDTPFILVSGAVTEDRAIEILTQGAKDYVLKNRLQRLIPAVRRALKEAEEQRARKMAEEELREAHRTLEERVRIRTAELEAEMAARKKAEEAFRESERRLRLAHQAAKIGAFEWNVETGVYTWTPELEAMYGLAPGEFGSTQLAWEELVHPEDRAAAVGLVHEAFETGRPVEGEWRVIWPDGSIHWIAGRFQAVRDAAGRALRLNGVNMNVTRRKRAEEALRESRAAFHLPGDDLPGRPVSPHAHETDGQGSDGVQTVVPRRQENEERVRRADEMWRTFFDCRIGGIGIVVADAEGGVRQANDYYLDLLGRTREELLAGQVKWSEMTPPEWREADEKGLAQLRERGVSDTCEKEYVRRDGTRVPVLVTGAVLPGEENAILAFVLDNTERKRREAEIANLASFPLLNPAPVIETDPAGSIHFCNPAAEVLFPDLRQRGREHPLLAGWEEVARSFDEGATEEITREVNFRGRWYREKLYRIGGTRRIRIYGEDITLRKAAETELTEHAARLEEANKELESFSYSVSHDLKAPLAAIDGYSRMLIKRHGDRVGEEAARMLNVIQSSVGKMNALIDDLLSFSRVLGNSMTLSEIDMGRLAGDVWSDIRSANRDREIEFNATNLLPGFGDRALIRQALFNLIHNAVKFTKNRRPGIIEMGSYAEPGGVVYSLKDNGAGFDMAYYHKMFGVFKRLHSDEEYGGTGVGLAIVQRIVKRHGGRIWAEGKVGEGATFRFFLPTREG